METSVLIAKIIGVIYLSFGVGLLINRNYYKKELPKLLENTSYLIFGGLVAIIIGALIIDNHNYWVKNWTVIITIIGWIAFLKGIVLLVFPTSFSSYKSILNSNLFYNILVPLVLILGIIFMYLGLFAD
jgi:hypothetical protein